MEAADRVPGPSTPAPAGPDPAAPGSAAPDPAAPDPAAPDPAAPGDAAHTDEVVRSVVKAERSPKDMAVSLLVLLVPIALVLGFYRLVLDGDRPVTVDPAPAVAQARAAGLPVSRPTGLSDDWAVLSAVFRRTDTGRVLRLGYRTPAGGGVQVVQSDAPAERLIPAELGDGARSRGPADVTGAPQGGAGWQWYTARPGERALVLLASDRTVLVVGATAERELRDLAASLR